MMSGVYFTLYKLRCCSQGSSGYTTRTLPLARRCNSLHDDPGPASQCEGYLTLQHQTSRHRHDNASSSVSDVTVNNSSPAIVITEDLFNIESEDAVSVDSRYRRSSFPFSSNASDIGKEDFGLDCPVPGATGSLMILSRSPTDSILSTSADSESKRGSNKSVAFRLPLCSDE